MSPKEESALLTSFEMHSRSLSGSDDDLTRHQGLMGLMVVRLVRESVFQKDLEKWCDEKGKKYAVQPTTLYGKLFAMRNQITFIAVALILKGLGPQLLELITKIIPGV